MTSATIRVGQINAVIRVQMKEKDKPMDLSSATTKRFKFQKPNGILMERDAAFATDGTDGVIQYATVTVDEIDCAGPWLGQPYIEMGIDSFHGSMFSFQVGEILGTPVPPDPSKLITGQTFGVVRR